MLLLKHLAVTKDHPQLSKAEVKTLQVCLNMQVLLPPPETKMLSGNRIYSSLPNLHTSACRKNGGMLHSLSKSKHAGQTKHDFQNILGCVRLSDLAKTGPLLELSQCKSDYLSFYSKFVVL